MPSRHISPQSFDDILSELGDDPAIPDPHGIRKTTYPKGPPLQPPKPTKEPTWPEAFGSQNLLGQVPKLAGFLTFGACVFGIGIALLIGYESLKTSSESQVQESLKEISELKKEFSQLRTELQMEQDDLYEIIDQIEVSVHSLIENRSIHKVTAKPQALPHEAELSRWRYLGASQMRGSHQAFFDSGQGTVMFQKGMLVLGDWRLTHLEKDLATLSHGKGKTLNLKPSKTE
ncbi:hypothetical protein [Polynucleobacter campilacus]|nr:hypothetical protein [Polynucleobacter campilacus]